MGSQSNTDAALEAPTCDLVVRQGRAGGSPHPRGPARTHQHGWLKSNQWEWPLGIPWKSPQVPPLVSSCHTSFFLFFNFTIVHTSCFSSSLDSRLCTSLSPFCWTNLKTEPWATQAPIKGLWRDTVDQVYREKLPVK